MAYFFVLDKRNLQKKKLPDAPGVYFFLGARKEILYIGKATSLRSRVRSYFTDDIKEKRSERIEKMVAQAKKVEWTTTDSILEALILEANLIRTHKPRYNTHAKDDKSYNHLIITNEEYPRVLVVRGKDLTEKYTKKELKYVFGPFPSGSLFKEALKIVRKIFRFYDTKKPLLEIKSKMGRGRIDFNRQLGLYPHTFHGAAQSASRHRRNSAMKGVGVYPGEQSKKEYGRTIRHVKLFFEGKKKQLIKELDRGMKKCAKEQRFEEANDIKKKIFALTHIQDVALIKDDMRIYRDAKSLRVEAYDVAHLSGEHMVGVMTVVERGEAKKSDYRKFKIRSVTGSNDPAALKEVLDRRLGHPEWPLPQIIVVDGSIAQKNAAESMLRKYGVLIPVVSVVKNEYHKVQRIIGSKKLVAAFENDILLANAEAHRLAVVFHRQRRGKRVLT